MSILTQAMVFEKYGPRLNMEQLAEVLNITKSALYNQLSAKTCAVKTYLDGGRRYADYRDVAEHLDAMRSLAA